MMRIETRVLWDISDLCAQMLSGVRMVVAVDLQVYFHNFSRIELRFPET
jgi:hypothetical protein